MFASTGRKFLLDLTKVVRPSRHQSDMTILHLASSGRCCAGDPSVDVIIWRLRRLLEVGFSQELAQHRRPRPPLMSMRCSSWSTADAYPSSLPESCRPSRRRAHHESVSAGDRVAKTARRAAGEDEGEGLVAPGAACGLSRPWTASLLEEGPRRARRSWEQEGGDSVASTPIEIERCIGDAMIAISGSTLTDDLERRDRSYCARRCAVCRPRRPMGPRSSGRPRPAQPRGFQLISGPGHGRPPSPHLRPDEKAGRQRPAA